MKWSRSAPPSANSRPSPKDETEKLQTETLRRYLGAATNSPIPTPAHSGSDICDVIRRERLCLLEAAHTLEEHTAIFKRNP